MKLLQFCFISAAHGEFQEGIEAARLMLFFIFKLCHFFGKGAKNEENRPDYILHQYDCCIVMILK